MSELTKRVDKECRLVEDSALLPPCPRRNLYREQQVPRVFTITSVDYDNVSCLCRLVHKSHLTQGNSTESYPMHGFHSNGQRECEYSNNCI